MTLSGKKILITRSAHQACDIMQAIERQGGKAIVFPTIEILPPVSWDACDRAINSLYMYDGLIFTSTNGVEHFLQRLRELNTTTDHLSSKMIFVVGEKTREAVEQEGLHVTVMPDKFTAADLSKKLESEDLHGKTFLFPRGNLGRDTLLDNLKLLGANVDSVIVYQTAKPQQHRIEEVRTMLLNGDIDVATFTSPSTFKNFAVLFSKKELCEIVDKMKIAVIGPATAKAVEEENLEADIVANQSTVESLVEALISHLKSEIRILDESSRRPKPEITS